MKTILAAILFFVVAPLAPLLAEDAPLVSARQALDIAEKNLADRGLTKEIYVISVAIQQTSMLNNHPYWFVKWSHPIPASNPRDREIGMKVTMEGVPTRLVKEAGKL
jgi:hypothetical protein